MAKELLFKKLKQILLEEERSEQQKIVDRLQEVDSKIEERNKLESRIAPILDDKVTDLQHNFSTLFGSEVTKSIKTQIRESQDEVVEALYPIIGKMIKKYIVKEFALLSEKVDKRIDQAFSAQAWIRRIKSWFGIKTKASVVEHALLEPQIEQILVIQKDSGLIIGSYSKSTSVDNDMVAGMITAIKAFAQDAFEKENQDLELIEYETFKLFIRTFKSFFIVTAVSGGINTSIKNKLDDLILDFANNILNKTKIDQDKERSLDTVMLQYFNKPNNED